MDNPLDDGQARAGPFEVLGAMQALKNAKQLVDILHVKSASIILNKKDKLAGLRVAADLDSRRGLFAGELDGVGQKVGKDVAEQRWVGVARGQIAHHDLHRPSLVVGFQSIEHFADDRGGGYRLRLKRLAAQPGEAEQVVHEASHMVGVIFHAFNVSRASAGSWPAYSSIKMREKLPMARKGARRSCETE